MDTEHFRNNISRYASRYNPAALFGKLRQVARKTGVRIVYVVLILYYATLDSRLPLKDRLMVMAALGYFIIPLDLMPDSLPLGFTDDYAALYFVLKQIWKNLTPETTLKARERIREWFGNVSETEFHIPGL